jgi:hypothetical protein
MTEHTLLAAEAKIKTSAVAVKVVRIGKRQMTQAVFRQLYREPIIGSADGGDECHLRGVPWGLVNYHNVCNGGSYKGHLHVVWQKDSELRRACVEPPDSGVSVETGEGFDCLARCGHGALTSLLADLRRRAAYALALAHPESVQVVEPAQYPYKAGVFAIAGLLRFADQHPYQQLVKFCRTMDRRPGDADSRWAQEEWHKDKVKAEADAALVATTFDETLRRAGITLPGASDAEAFLRHVQGLARGLTERLARMKASYQCCYEELAALDQLFIAV